MFVVQADGLQEVYVDADTQEVALDSFKKFCNQDILNDYLNSPTFRVREIVQVSPHNWEYVAIR